ncbi:long-chain-fatty-acid--CoA ligase [Gemmatimonadetes bacterium T265]|nr:long-chain-fatty-acid--CoA ligase [Gemmatimonadetes bacterium T265]
MDGLRLRQVTMRERVWRRVHDRCKCDGGRPVVWTEEGEIGLARLVAGANARLAELCGAGVRRGDRVVCALAAGPAFVELSLAALEAEWTLVPVPPSADTSAMADAVDARAVVTTRDVRVRGAATPPTPDVRFLLATSGTTGAPRRLALSDANLAAVLDSHRDALALNGGVLLSVLPWHHAFGLALELLPALLDGAMVVRDSSGGRDAAEMLSTAERAAARGSAITHLHAVPYTTRLLAADEAGQTFLGGLRGGLVGGAPVDAALAAALARTRLRVGYGQTEASPGVCLGAPGAWRAAALGRPVGCAVRLDPDGVLAFRGPNACLGEWHAGRASPLERLPADRWVRTGDLAVAEDDGTYTFAGRAAESFKLENGRYVAALPIEAAVRARHPQVREAVLSSPDGVSFVLAVSADGHLPAVDAVRPLLGPLAERPLRVVPVAADAWVRTPKGEIDRRFPVGRAS